MTIKEYRNQFIRLFKEMENEHGCCSEVRIKTEDEQTDYSGNVVASRAVCHIQF